MPYRVDGAIGRYEFTTHCVPSVYNTAVDFHPKLKGREIYRTKSFRQFALFNQCTESSYRHCATQLNVLRRQPNATGSRTLCNAAEQEAKQVSGELRRLTTQHLPDRDYDAAGRPRHPLMAPPGGDFTPAQLAAAAEACLRADPKCPLTAADLLANPLPTELPDLRPAIAIDDVGVKKQKAQRAGKPPPRDGKKRVWNTVAQLRYRQARYTLVAHSVPEVLRQCSALLAASQLQHTELLLLTDGQRSLKDSIYEFWQTRGGYRLILDWYHLQHKCRELGSLGLAGSISDKAITINELKQLLWYGQTDRAIAYLQNLPGHCVKRPTVISQIIGYLERNRQHIPCYAIRRQLGLPCSSNQVEKANDRVVAKRQKHNGMSWSDAGSHNLAQLSAVVRNGETQHWLTTGTLRFSLAPPARAA